MVIKCNIYLAKHADCGIIPVCVLFFVYIVFFRMGGSRLANNEYYPLDYGRYDSVEKWSNFCSSQCRCFSECTKKGGYCSSTNRRLLPPRQTDFGDSLIQESSEIYGELKKQLTLRSGSNLSRRASFWHFPEGRGSLQPWRSKLWERNK